MPTEKNKKGALKHHVYQTVLTNVVNGKYQPDQILTEKGLMEQFEGVSRAPIREALIELCNEQVLESIPCYGYKIKALTTKDIMDIQRFRIVMEVGFMSHYWHMITAEDIQDLEAMIAKPEEKSAFGHWEHNSDFHMRLMQCYDDPFALKQLKMALSVQTRAFAQKRWESWKESAFSEPPYVHMQIIDAIRNDNMVLACKLLETDIRTI
ncbi:MAG: GntR family transcriptional regulator [Lachnospiraceae bacterium]|jgi:DNA-binding GntR family transcriptional regulator|nr:GntR family transcriptional regulator [Lachnospiraceae bacterium]